MKKSESRKKTDVFWVNRAGVVPYVKAKHFQSIYDFLYWEKGEGEKALLIIGDGSYFGDSDDHGSLLRCFSLYKPIAPEHFPDGAGKRWINSIIWESATFLIRTPAHLQSIIMDLLKEGEKNEKRKKSK